MLCQLVGCHLYMGTIVWRHMRVRAVLRYRRSGIVKTFEGLVVKWGHGEMDFAFAVVPVKVDLDIFSASVIKRDIIIFLGCQ